MQPFNALLARSLFKKPSRFEKVSPRGYQTTNHQWNVFCFKCLIAFATGTSHKKSCDPLFQLSHSLSEGLGFLQ
jgi:hypothetical protein